MFSFKFVSLKEKSPPAGSHSIPYKKISFSADF
ncbi:hypothetical protein N399_13445 [Bacillus licheniformis CG-B52]|nr:hypothetical protein N399_13445 [Bacillus licheniformis CG-B52]KUL10901.1 hypothetical protein LI17339_12575 [Bacillus licheniformis LMG 17339]